jgi:hypothetical protein
MSSSPGPGSAKGAPSDALLWPLQPGVFPGARALRRLRAAHAASAAAPFPAPQRSPPRHANHWRTIAPPRADAATSAVLAALPSGAKPCLRLSCRAGRAAVDAHARRLEVGHGHALHSPAAVTCMPMLQELVLYAYNATNTLALAAGLRAVARGPAQLRRALVWAHGGGSALGSLVSSLAGLTALTRMELGVHLDVVNPWTAPPMVLPWTHIEVRGCGCTRGWGTPAGHVVWGASDGEAPYLCPLDALFTHGGRDCACSVAPGSVEVLPWDSTSARPAASQHRSTFLSCLTDRLTA